MSKNIRDFFFSISVSFLIFSSPFALLNNGNHKILSEIEAFFSQNPELTSKINYKKYTNNMSSKLNNYFEFSYEDALSYNKSYIELEEEVFNLTNKRIINKNFQGDFSEEKIKTEQKLKKLYIYSLLFFIFSPIFYLGIAMLSRKKMIQNYKKSVNLTLKNKKFKNHNSD